MGWLRIRHFAFFTRMLNSYRGERALPDTWLINFLAGKPDSAAGHTADMRAPYGSTREVQVAHSWHSWSSMFTHVTEGRAGRILTVPLV